MSEFYVRLTDEEISALISIKTKMYDEYFLGKYSSQLSHTAFIYRRYADFHNKKSGTFELYRYSAMCEGEYIYAFFVETTATEETKKALEDREMRFKISTMTNSLTSKFEKMKIAELNTELETRGLDTKGRRRVDKISKLVKYEIQK